MVHDAMPSRGKVQQIQLRPITAAACRSPQSWVRYPQGRCADISAQGHNHDAGASRKQCPEHSQRPQIWGRLTEPKVGRSAQGAAYCADPFAGAEVGPPLSPEKWKGVKRIHTLAGRHGSTLLNIRAAAQATFSGKEAVMPHIAPAAPRPGRPR